MQEGGSWTPDLGFRNYSTAVDTRSLSISLFPAANESSTSNAHLGSISNIALLYYENPNGKVSALLYRLLAIERKLGEPQSSYLQDQWVDVTSQESRALPDEFFNPDIIHSFSTKYDRNATFSHTLYDVNPNIVYSTPFTSAANFYWFAAGALFYSLLDPMLNTTSPSTSPIAGGFFYVIYDTGFSGLGNFSIVGMHYSPSYTELFFVK